MLLFIDDIAAKQIIAPVLNVLVGDPKKVFEPYHVQIWEAVRALGKRAIKSGHLRKDLDPLDLLRALIGVANFSTSPDWQPSAPRPMPLSFPSSGNSAEIVGQLFKLRTRFPAGPAAWKGGCGQE